MFYKKTLYILTAILLLGMSGLSARDTATFVDLGFSPDSNTFMFAQYGVQAGTLRPWAELFIIDVPANNFVSGGIMVYTHDSPVVFGQDGSGAFHSALVRNAPIVERHRINHSIQGRPLYIAHRVFGGRYLVCYVENSTSNRIEFRDFETGASYRATLVTTVEGSGASLRSSFHINVEREARDGTRIHYMVGAPHLSHPLVSSYRIRQVRVFGDAMIFIIETHKQEGGNISVRYMVEALQRVPF